MKERKPGGVSTLWRTLNEMTVRQLVEQLPEKTVGGVSAALLAALAVLPVFVSFSFRMPEEYLADVVDLQYAGVLYSFVLGSYWFRCLLILGAFGALLAAFRLAKDGYSGEFQGCFRLTWIRERWLPACLLALLVWSLLSALLSTDLRVSFLGDDYRQEGFLTYVVYAILFVAALLPDTRQQKWVAEVLTACCAFTGLLVITQWDCFYLEEDLRAAMFHQYNHYGYFLAICFPLCFGLILNDEQPKRWLRAVRLGEFWLICNAVAFNSVRGSFLGILAALAGWHIVILMNHRKRWKRLLMLDLVFAATILHFNTGSTLLDRFGTLFDQLEEVQQVVPSATEASAATQAADIAAPSKALDNLGSERGLLWRLGIRFAMERPVFGYGPDNLGYLYNAYREGMVDRPHNELIQIAASLGLPALAFYVAGLAGHAANFCRRFRKLSIFQLGLFASVGSYLVSSLFGNTMYYTTPYFYMMLAFSCRACNAKETA